MIEAQVQSNSQHSALPKREWLLSSLAELRKLSCESLEIPRCRTIGADDFLDKHYALNKPVLLTHELADWPAIKRWTPAYLKAKVGPTAIEFQAGRSQAANYERFKDRHRANMPFDAFIDLIESSADGNDAYITAYNGGSNRLAFAPLADDLGRLDHILEGELSDHGHLWIGGAGTFTPLHHDLTNNLLIQVTGTKHVLMAPPEEVSRLYNDKHVFSEIEDLENVDLERYPAAADIHAYRTELRAGQALFIPLAWWHQVVSLEFGVSITFTNFRWRNDFYETYPED